MKVGIAALLALGLNVVVGFAGLLDLGYVAFFAVGAYTAPSRRARPSTAWRSSAQQNVSALHPEWHMYFWLFFFLAIGIAIGARACSSARRPCGCAATTWPSSRWGSARSCASPRTTWTRMANGPRGVLEMPHPEIDVGIVPLRVRHQQRTVLLAPVSHHRDLDLPFERLNDSRVGRAWAAIREDELAAASMGVPTVRMKLWAFSIGAAVASLGGVHLRELGVVHQPGHVRACSTSRSGR